MNTFYSHSLCCNKESWYWPFFKLLAFVPRRKQMHWSYTTTTAGPMKGCFLCSYLLWPWLAMLTLATHPRSSNTGLRCQVEDSVEDRIHAVEAYICIHFLSQGHAALCFSSMDSVCPRCLLAVVDKLCTQGQTAADTLPIMFWAVRNRKWVINARGQGKPGFL